MITLLPVATAHEELDAMWAIDPTAQFDPLSTDLVAAAQCDERREFLVGLGLDALEQEPIREELRRLRAAVLRQTRDERDGALLSRREVARLLGISRTRTLGPAIAAGVVRTVRVGGELRVPAEEVARVAREGLVRARRSTTARPRSAVPVQLPDLASELAAVRALKPPPRT